MCEQFAGENDWDDDLLGYRVVLLDLDSTLIKSGTFRKVAARNALTKLLEHWPGPDIEVCCRAYNAIYDCHDTIRGKVGPNGYIFEDTRQKWNTRSSYALLIAWHVLGSSLAGSARDQREYTGELGRVLLDQPDDLLKRAENILQGQNVELSEALDAAVTGFWVDLGANWDTTMVYDGVRDMLGKLRAASIRYYVATEGDLETQWRKIRAVGLDDLIPEKLLLSTGQAARPEDDLNPLVQILDRYQRREKAYDVTGKFLAAAAGDGIANATAIIEKARGAAHNVVAGLAFIEGLFKTLGKRFYRIQSVSEDSRVQPEFYKIALYAINHDLLNPRRTLSSLNMEWNPDHKLRVVMVGDNPKNDIEPVITLGRVLTKDILPIWIRQDPVTVNKYNDDKNRPTDNPPLHDEKRSIVEVANLLLDHNTWRGADDTIDRKKVIDKLHPLFASALTDPVPTIQVSNIASFLTGVSAIGSDFINNPEDKVLEKAHHFVVKLFRNVVSDVSRDESANVILTQAFRVCQQQRGANMPRPDLFPKTLIEFIVGVTEKIIEHRDLLVPLKPKRDSFIDSLLGDFVTRFLLDAHGNVECSGWTSSFIHRLGRSDIIMPYIAIDGTLRGTYCRALAKCQNAQCLTFDAQDAAISMSVLLGC